MFDEEEDYLPPTVEEIERRRAAIEQQRYTAPPWVAQQPATSRATPTGARHPLTAQHRAAIADGMKRRRAVQDRKDASPLRLARLDRGLSIAEAAALAGVSPTTFSAMETTPTLVSRISRGKIRRVFTEVEL